MEGKSYDNGTHVGDVAQTICPRGYSVKCKCGWYGHATTVDELQAQFSEHKHLEKWNPTV